MGWSYSRNNWTNCFDNLFNQKTQENAVDTITNLLKKEEETRTTELAFEKARIDNLLTSFNIDEVKLTNVISSYAAADTDIMDRINGFNNRFNNRFIRLDYKLKQL